MIYQVRLGAGLPSGADRRSRLVEDKHSQVSVAARTVRMKRRGIHGRPPVLQLDVRATSPGRGFLGHRVSAAGVAVDPRKVAAVQEWLVLTSSVDLRRFIGLCNYYRRFVDA